MGVQRPSGLHLPALALGFERMIRSEQESADFPSSKTLIVGGSECNVASPHRQPTLRAQVEQGRPGGP